MHSTLTDNLALVKPGSISVGIDLSLDKNVAVVLNEQGQRLDRFSFPTGRDGYAYLLQRLAALQSRHQAPALQIGMEPTNYYWKLLAAYLEQAGWPYRLVNPYTVKKHREGDQLDRSKDDQRDAATIAELVRTGKYTQTSLSHGVYAELRNRAKEYVRLHRDLARQKSLLWGQVGQAFPELTQAFQKLGGESAQALLRQHACAAHIRSLGEASFLAGVRQDLRGRRLAVKKVKQAYRLAQTSIGLEDGLQALQASISLRLETLDLLVRQCQQARSDLLACFLALPAASWMLSFPDLGALPAALILSEVGDPQRYQHACQWVKLAGTQPTPNASGRKSASQTPMSHKGRALLRTVVYLAVLRLLQVNPAFQARYQQLQTRPQHPLNKMQSIGVLMNKLLRILWALVHNQTRYDPRLV